MISTALLHTHPPLFICSDSWNTTASHTVHGATLWYISAIKYFTGHDFAIKRLNVLSQCVTGLYLTAKLKRTLKHSSSMKPLHASQILIHSLFPCFWEIVCWGAAVWVDWSQPRVGGAGSNTMHYITNILICNTNEVLIGPYDADTLISPLHEPMIFLTWAIMEKLSGRNGCFVRLWVVPPLCYSFLHAPRSNPTDELFFEFMTRCPYWTSWLQGVETLFPNTARAPFDIQEDTFQKT